MAVATQSILFTAADTDELAMGDANFALTDRSKFSIYARFRRDSTASSGVMSIMRQQAANGLDISFSLILNNDSLEFHTSVTGFSFEGRLVTTATYTDTAEWVSVLVHYDEANATSGDRMRMWVGLDGAEMSEVTSFTVDIEPDEAIRDSSAAVRVGQSGTGSNSFDGVIYQLTYFDGVLADVSDVQSGGITLDTGSFTGAHSLLSVPSGVITDDEILVPNWIALSGSPAADNEIPPYSLTVADTIAASATGTSSIVKKMFNSLSATGTGSGSLSSTSILSQVLNAVATGTSSLVNLCTKFATLSASAQGLATVYKKSFNSLAASAIGAAVNNAVKSFFQALASSAVGGATVSSISIFSRTLSASATGASSLVRAIYKNIQASIVGVGSLTKKTFVSLNKTVVNTVTLIKGRFVSLSASATGLTVVNSIKYSFITLGAAATGTSNIVKVIFKNLSASANGVASFVKKMFKSLSTSGSGTGSLTVNNDVLAIITPPERVHTPRPESRVYTASEDGSFVEDKTKGYY